MGATTIYRQRLTDYLRNPLVGICLRHQCHMRFSSSNTINRTNTSTSSIINTMGYRILTSYHMR